MMLKDHARRLAIIRRRTVVMAVMALIVPATALAAASPAMAEPKGIFKIFKECPTEIPSVSLCSVDTTTGGEVSIGSTAVPINKDIVQQGGFVKTGNPENGREFFGLPAKNGESLSKTELNVPGGLLDFIKCEEIKGSGLIEVFFRELCKATFEHGVTAVTATTELVANEKNPVLFNERALAREEGTAITLPVRVHLKNSLLGNNCYIGSESSPLELHLTTGATSLKSPPKGWKSIHGAKGTATTLEEKELVSLRLTGNELVDNTWSAPGVEGCGEAEILFIKVKGFLDSLVNAKLKLPDAAGENTAILKGELAAAAAEEVVLSESF
jgi:hypothetical protein